MFRWERNDANKVCAPFHICTAKKRRGPGISRAPSHFTFTAR